jgi:quercetin dioxygenase-like cupin family protein
MKTKVLGLALLCALVTAASSLAAVAVMVTGGTLTVSDPKVNACGPFKVSKGQSFVEPADHIHLARNDGTRPATVYALYLGVPKASHSYIPETQPAGCNA